MGKTRASRSLKTIFLAFFLFLAWCFIFCVGFFFFVSVGFSFLFSFFPSSCVSGTGGFVGVMVVISSCSPFGNRRRRQIDFFLIISFGCFSFFYKKDIYICLKDACNMGL